jgi:urease accessory protein
MPRVRRPETRTPPAALLQLMWLASPALPVGGFSYSEGLEAAVEAGLAASEDAVRRWLLDQLHLSLATADLAVVVRAVPAWQRHDATRLAELNAWVLMTRETAEARLQTEQMGRSMLDWLRQRATDPARLATLAALGSPSYPLAWALAAAAVPAVTPADAGLAFAFGWAENLVQAAIKAVPLGQSAGQRILGALAAELPDAVARAESLPDSARQAYTPGLAILGARHETQYSRLFRS